MKANAIVLLFLCATPSVLPKYLDDLPKCTFSEMGMLNDIHVLT